MRVIGASWIQRLSLLVACTGLLLPPALAQASEEDPWQGYNRFMFRINDNVDAYTLKPLAKGYQAVTPQFLEDGVHNVFRNIGDVGNLANNLLQGKLHDAGVDSSRLIFNTFPVIARHAPQRTSFRHSRSILAPAHHFA